MLKSYNRGLEIINWKLRLLDAKARVQMFRVMDDFGLISNRQYHNIMDGYRFEFSKLQAELEEMRAKGYGKPS